MGDDPNFADRPLNKGLPDDVFEEHMEYLINHPFNLTPETMPENIEDNELLDALAAMKR